MSKRNQVKFGKYLSIDPGLRFMGYSVFGGEDEIIESETIKFNTKFSQEKRMHQIYDTLTNVISRHRIEHVITEYQFVNTMSNIVGVIMAVAGSDDNIKFKKITPSSWKKTGFGKGNIDEKELSNKIIDVYPEAKDFSEHQIDTIGMFIAYKKIIDEDNEVGDNVIPKNTKANSKRKKPSKN